MRTRKATVYPGSMNDLRMLVEYDQIDGVVRYTGPFKSKPTRDKHGHLLLKLPVDVMQVERRQRVAKYYRVDHIVWALVAGQWPEGWIIHLNGLRTDCAIDNLTHLDDDMALWWILNGELVEVQYNSVGPITYRVTDGDQAFVLPKLVGVRYEDEDGWQTDGTSAPHTQSVGSVPQVPDPG